MRCPLRSANCRPFVKRIMSWVPQAGGIALGVSMISSAGSMTLGAIADEGSLADPQELVDGFVAELVQYGVLVHGSEG